MMTWRNVLAGALALGLVVPGQVSAQTATTVGQTAVATGAPTLAGTPVTSRADLAAAFATKADVASPAFSGVATFQDVTINGTLRGAGNFLPLGGGALTGGLSGTTGSFSGALSGGTLNVTGATTLAGGTFSGTFAGAHTYSGALTLSAAGTALNVTNNALIGGTLGVTGLLSGTSETLTGNFTGTTATFSGFLTEGGNTVANPALILNGSGAGQVGVRFQVAGVNRWRWLSGNAELGNNTGSDTILQSYTDAGVATNLMQITRSTGLFQHNSNMLVQKTVTDNSSQIGLTGSVVITSGGGRYATYEGGKFTATNLNYVPNLDPAWATGTSYVTGFVVNVNGFLLTATSSGVSGATTPTCSAPNPTCSDGGVSWSYLGSLGSSYGMIGGFISGNITNSFGGLAGAPIGVVFGLNTQANISVANAVGVVGYELNYGTAFPALQRVGLQIIAGTSGVAQGTQVDTAFRIGTQAGAAPLKHFIDLGGYTATTPLDPNGYALRVFSGGFNAGQGPAVQMAGAGGIDFTEFTATGVGEFGGGFIFRGPGSQILTSGDVQSNYALLHQTATGASLDASQFHVTAAAVHSGGGGTGWTSSGGLATCADGSLLKVTGISGGAVTGLSVVIGSYGSAAPSNPVVCTSEGIAGGNDNAGNSIFPSTIQVDMTATLANSGAPVLALGGVATVTAATAAPGTNTTQIATTAFSAAAVAVEAARATAAEGLLAPKASPTFTGTANAGSIVATGVVTGQSGLTAGTSTATQPIFINGPAGANRNLIWQTAGVKRFQININNTAEGGANVGSDVAMAVSDDSGATTFTPIFITRSTGLTTMNNLSATMTGGTVNNVIIGGSTPLAGTFTTLTASSIKVGANQVVGARQTGWTAMTGTPDLATAFATSTVTLAQLAGRVMSLQAAMTTHGLIGP